MGPTDVRSQAGAVAMVEGTAEHGAYPCEARREGAGDGVRWFGPQREPDRRALADWCSGVGPVELRAQPAFGGSPSSQAPDSTFTVATWNVHVGGGDLIGFLQGELEYGCDAQGPRKRNRHFALLVQEAHRASSAVPEASEGAVSRKRIAATPPNGPRHDIVQIAERCGLALFYVPSMRNGLEPGERGREDRGSAILSTLPLADPIAIEVPFEAQRRVTVVASVRGPGDTVLRLASVHFDVAGNILRVLGTGGSMRVRQNDGLTEALDLVDPERDTPIVVAGDLNTWSYRETVVQRMLETYPDSPPPGKEKTRGDWPPDHLFFRAGSSALGLVEGSYRVAEDAFGSDHKARLVILSAR
ncbi:MAG: endonuclease/exonuclease/phosphatase family protein [marine benthic group bacterium]|nr:endonuclease/exonuclease/phosphatase family protein [Gemmatimonadota bacterium]